MKLDAHLIAKTAPQAHEKNIVRWRDYRVTVLGERLFRLEKSATLSWRNDATQAVWFRNVPPQSFTVTQDETQCAVTTNGCTLLLRPARRDCRVLMQEKACEISDKGNLLGTCRTLDGADGDRYLYDAIGDQFSFGTMKVKLQNGVCSRTGVAVFDDAKSYTLDENGEVQPVCGDGTDEYIFCFGSDYRAAVRALYTICGRVPLIPRYALGNWWSRYHAYSDTEYLELLNTFEEYNVPLTVATIDMDWHYSFKNDIDETFGVTAEGRNTPAYLGAPDTEDWDTDYNWGWTGYTWNKRLFPAYKKFLAELKKRNVKTTLNLHPAAGVRYWEEQYEDMARAMGVDPASRMPVPFDIDDPAFANEYFKILHKPMEEDGVTFWWMDWQQGKKWGKKEIDPLWSLNHYHYLDNAKNHAVPLILSRYAGVGSHRYPLGFSGDTYITWNTLKFMPYFTATASNIGYTWWSHDIGGHHMGAMDEQLYLRFLQYGVFSPINRMHCTSMEIVTKEPWVYGNGCGSIAMDFLRLRHRMIPFLYACGYRTYSEGTALTEPLYYAYPACEQAYAYKNEYLFGGLLAAPVTERVRADGFARVKMWLPQGKWTDIFTGDEYTVTEKDGAEKTLLRTLESMPVLAPAGAVLPLSLDTGNSADNPRTLEINAYNGDGAFDLYEDGSERNDARAFVTHFTLRYAENGKNAVQTLCISSEGEKSVLPASRDLRLVFRNVTQGNVSVTANGAPVPVRGLYEECAANEARQRLADRVTVEIPFAPETNYEISVAFVNDTLAQVKERAKRVLQSAQGDNIKKDKLFVALRSAADLQAFAAAVQAADCAEAIKARLTETL